MKTFPELVRVYAVVVRSGTSETLGGVTYSYESAQVAAGNLTSAVRAAHVVTRLASTPVPVNGPLPQHPVAAWEYGQEPPQLSPRMGHPDERSPLIRVTTAYTETTTHARLATKWVEAFHRPGPLSVACTRCKAGAGERCVRGSGAPCAPHAARVTEVERRLAKKEAFDAGLPNGTLVHVRATDDPETFETTTAPANQIDGAGLHFVAWAS